MTSKGLCGEKLATEVPAGGKIRGGGLLVFQY
jgi:hypothetical protein